jgi:hypothetical protein
MTAPTTLSGAAAGFPLTLTDAARRMSLSPDAVLDLVRSGCLGAYVAAAHETTERPPLRFDELGLTSLHAALSGDGEDTAHTYRVTVTHAVAAGLRRFLVTTAPSDTATVAHREDRPLLAVGGGGALFAHVRTAQVERAALDGAGMAVRVRLALPDAVPHALARLGCQKVRGVRPAGEAGKDWKTWWRVPLSIWSLSEEDALRVDDFPALGGIRDGE